MCYNCGCLLPQDDMGNSKNITDLTFSQIAEKLGKTEKEIKELCLSYLNGENIGEEETGEIEKMFDEASKAWGQAQEEAKKETKKLLVSTLS